MKIPLPKRSFFSKRLSLGSITLRTKLILGNILIAFIAIIGTGYYVFLRSQQESTYLTTQLDTNVQQQAEEKLTSTSVEQALVLNNFFASIKDNIITVGDTTENLLSHEMIFSNGNYWDAAQSLVRLPNGSWDNSNTDPASIFIPAKIDLSYRLVSELNTIRQLDFLVPSILAKNSDTVAMYFGGTSGETLYYPNVDLASLVPPDFDVTTRPWFVKAAPISNPGRTAVWSDPYLDAALHGLVVTASSPVYDSGGNFAGVVAMDIQLNRITGLVSNIHVGETGYAFLIDKNERLVAMPDSGYKDFGLSPSTTPLGALFYQSTIKNVPSNFYILLAKIASGESGLDTISIGGVDRFIVYQPIPEVDYGLAIIVPSSEMLAESILAKEQIAQVTRNTVTQSIFLVAGILVIAILATLLISNGLTNPLTALTRTAQEITNGDLDAKIQVQSKDEIGTLAKTLNVMTTTLRENIQSLEDRVAERTSELEAESRHAERRASQLEVVALITQAINSIRKTEELLPRITTLISEQFNYYHVGIFLNDESNQYAILSAANSEGGRRMLNRGHRLMIGEQGIVGRVAASGTIRIARNVGDDAAYFNNPDLPETSAEMALPLQIGARTVGVLDVQSLQTNAFSDEDIKVLAILADQVSLAIDNARLFDTTRRSLAEAEALSRQYSHQTWSRLPSEQNLIGFRYSGTSAQPIEAPLQLSNTPESEHKKQKSASNSLSVPISLRGETIGNLIVQLPSGHSWSQEQIDLVNAVADRVALAAENARLFEETTRQANRERTVSDITSKIRTTTDPQTMLTTAIEELKKVLGTDEIRIRPYVTLPVNQAIKTHGTPNKKNRKAEN